MTSRDFCFWLQGYLEINAVRHRSVYTPANVPADLDPEQVECIRRHLALVFLHEVDQSYAGLDQKKAQVIHDGVPLSPTAGDPAAGLPTAGTPPPTQFVNGPDTKPYDGGLLVRC